jgi:hypothetical protein
LLTFFGGDDEGFLDFNRCDTATGTPIRGDSVRNVERWPTPTSCRRKIDEFMTVEKLDPVN